MKKSRTTRKQLVTQNALAIAAAYVLTTIHHVYGGLVDKAPNRLRVPVIMAVPTLAARSTGTSEPAARLRWLPPPP
jgi:hypothetical protein